MWAEFAGRRALHALPPLRNGCCRCCTCPTHGWSGTVAPGVARLDRTEPGAAGRLSRPPHLGVWRCGCVSSTSRTRQVQSIKVSFLNCFFYFSCWICFHELAFNSVAFLLSGGTVLACWVRWGLRWCPCYPKRLLRQLPRKTKARAIIDWNLLTLVTAIPPSLTHGRLWYASHTHLIVCFLSLYGRLPAFVGRLFIWNAILCSLGAALTNWPKYRCRQNELWPCDQYKGPSRL